MSKESFPWRYVLCNPFHPHRPRSRVSAHSLLSPLFLLPSPAQSTNRCPLQLTQDVFALGDCAMIEGTDYPATAQVASQKAQWLATRLNGNKMEGDGFRWRNLGLMAYIGGWRAIMQTGLPGGNISGRSAWLVWRGAYLTKSVSWGNKILIPMYWFLNWAFGRDISRF